MVDQRLKRLHLMLSGLGLRTDYGDWLLPEVLLACAYPRTDAALEALQASGIGLLINLHERPHSSDRLAAFGLTSLHLPSPDFSTPTAAQIDEAIGAIDAARARNERVAVHCGAGLGRTGTVLACYLVTQGETAHTAIQRVRELRPGSIETGEQAEAIRQFEATRQKETFGPQSSR
jgi:atypical dual specificity phosphatase